MPIRWDSVLVRHLALELDEKLEGARLRALRLDGNERDLVLLFRERTLLWRLHPERGHLLLSEALDPLETDLRLRSRLRRVEAPADERIVRFELLGERGRRSRFELIVELLGNQWNALVAEGAELVVRHVLRRRDRGRIQRVGSRYEPPVRRERAGVRSAMSVEEWRSVLEPVPPGERARVLTSTFAWASPINAEAILGAAGQSEAVELLDGAYRRWTEIATGEKVAPVVLETERGLQPYPVPLPGVQSRSVEGLIAGFELCASEADAEGDTGVALAIGAESLAQLEEAVRRQRRRVDRLRAELDGLEAPAAARAIGDLILARFAEIAPGATEATLLDFEENEVVVELDPTLPAHENANRYYERASKSERASERLPPMIADAERVGRNLEALLDRARAGEADPDEVRAALPKTAKPVRGAQQGPSVPYRSFRSSGGLEIRVGRGAKHNDELTFRHSAPGDVWLHARHSAGAHVVLRWQSDDAPPARDLEEAANLAALHSRARTSGSVPVDWTRRKYVRKPRGASPGTVVLERERTVFVEPDPSLMESLADPDEPGRS